MDTSIEHSRLNVGDPVRIVRRGKRTTYGTVLGVSAHFKTKGCIYVNVVQPSGEYLQQLYWRQEVQLDKPDDDFFIYKSKAE